MEPDEDSVPLDEYWLRKTYPLASYIVALGGSLLWAGITGNVEVGSKEGMNIAEGIFGGFIIAGGVLSWFNGWRMLPATYHVIAAALNLMGVVIGLLASYAMPETGQLRPLMLAALFSVCAVHTVWRLLTGAYSSG